MGGKKRKTSVLKVDFSSDDFVSVSESLHPSSENSDTKFLREMLEFLFIT